MTQQDGIRMTHLVAFDFKPSDLPPAKVTWVDGTPIPPEAITVTGPDEDGFYLWHVDLTKLGPQG